MKRDQIDNALDSIVVTVPEDISYRTKNPNQCAMAKACKLLDDVEDAAIYTSVAYIKFKNKEKWLRYRVPNGARKEIIKFDKTAKFEPGTYKLVPIQPSHRASHTRLGTAETGQGGNWTKRQIPVRIPGIRAKAVISAI